MLRIPGRIPIHIHPFFWILAALIGWLNSGSILGIVIWIGIVFVSVLVHEFGHALTALAFGKNPEISLVALGGLTSYEPQKLKFWQQFIIVLNGPLAGYALALFATILLLFITQPTLYQIVKIFQIVNIFWSTVNLIPILPLDGGQLLRIVLEGFFGLKGFKIALFIGMIIAALLACLLFFTRFFLLGALFFLFAFQSFDMWRKSKHLTDTDRNDDNRKDMMEAESALKRNDKETAKKYLEKVRSQSKRGVLYNTATEYLAMIVNQEGNQLHAYDLLLEVKDKVSDQSLALLHELAFYQNNFELVASLSSKCYQLFPSQKCALNNARAFASLNKPKHSGGWLQTALRFGDINIHNVLSEKFFESIKNNPEFSRFLPKDV